MVISARNPIHSVLFLILVFVNVIFILIHLEVEFLALTFVIVYVGAVAVLFLFVVMMLNIKIVELNKELIHYFPIGGLIGLIFLVDVFFIIFKSDVTPLLNTNFINQFGITDWFSIVDDVSNIETMGNLIYTYYFYFFLSSAVVLSIAMVIVLNLPRFHFFNFNGKIGEILFNIGFVEFIFSIPSVIFTFLLYCFLVFLQV